VVLRRRGHRPLARLVVIEAGRTTAIDATLEPLEGAALIESLRRALSAGPEPSTLSALAAAAGVSELLLVRGDAGALEAAHFRGDQLSRWVTADRRGLEALFPADLRVRDRDPATPPVDLGLATGPSRDSTPWYRTTRGMVGLGVGGAVVAAAIAGSIAYATRDTELGLTFCGVGVACPGE
jgi:hypothetical protein